MDFADVFAVARDALRLAERWQTLAAGLIAVWPGRLLTGACASSRGDLVDRATRRRHAFARAVGQGVERLRGEALRVASSATAAVEKMDVYFDHRQLSLQPDPLFDSDWETLTCGASPTRLRTDISKHLRLA